MEVTVSGVPRARRAELQTLIVRLRGSYSGTLTVGRTAAVVVEGTQPLDWMQPKLAAAVANGIPVASIDWLLDSQHHGFLLAPARYRLQPPAQGGARRSSAASTSLACAAASAAAAPSPERLRAAAPAQRVQGEGFLELPGSPAAPSRSGSASGTHRPAQQAVQPDAVADLPPSPVATAPPAEPLGSSAVLHSPLQLPDAGEQGGELEVALLLHQQEQQEEEQPAAAAPAGGAVTPAGAAQHSSPAPPTDELDSSAKIARFLSRLPAVTVTRGTCMPRRCPPDSPSLLSSLSGQGHAPRPGGGGASGRCSSGGTSWLLGRPALRALQAEGEAAQQQLQQPTDCDEGKAARQRPSLAEGGSRLPATTLVQLGPRLRRPPPRATLQSCAEMHSGGAVADLPPLSFHASAAALPEEGGELEFVAGDTARGARILYDILPDGRRLYALTLVQSIYRLGDEAWMEHRYLLSQQDLAERPAWAAALRGVAIKEGELLLSASVYHSPMHLIAGAFSVRYPGRVQLASAGGAAAAKAAAKGAAGSLAAEVYTCRRGFDTACGAVVPLRRALEGLGQQSG